MKQLLRNLDWLDRYVCTFGVKLIDIQSGTSTIIKNNVLRDISNIPTTSRAHDESPVKITGSDETIATNISELDTPNNSYEKEADKITGQWKSVYFVNVKNVWNGTCAYCFKITKFSISISVSTPIQVKHEFVAPEIKKNNRRTKALKGKLILKFSNILCTFMHMSDYL